MGAGARAQVRHVARGQVRYVAQDAPTGYGDAADRLVRALRAAGVGVEYRGYATPVDAGGPAIVRHSRDPRPDDVAPPGAPSIVHLVPEHYPEVRAATGDGAFVAHTVWETDRLPEHWPALLNATDRVIVPTAWNRDVFTACGVTAPIAVVPHVVCDPVPGDGGRPLELPDDVVVFYTISRWDQRKQPAAVVRAFVEAFTADDPVALVVKTSPNVQFPPDPTWGGSSPLVGTTAFEIVRLLRDVPNPPLVRLETDLWPPVRIAGLHARGDCFVSLSHGEGWDIGAFDAAAYGNPVVATGWGGTLEYLPADEAFLVDVDLVPVEHFEPQSYAPEQQWAEPRLDHAVELLRAVAAEPGTARRRAAPLAARVLETYAPARVVERLVDAVPELGLDVLPSPAPSVRRPTIPRVAHYVWGLRPEPEPFHLVHFLAIASCLELVQPEAVHLHCAHPPTGPWWDRIADRVTMHTVEPVDAVRDLTYADPYIAGNAYAHHADFVRLDALAEHGGLYADLDTLFRAPIPDDLWRRPFVIGREADVVDPLYPVPRPALSNAVMLAAPASAFVDAWRDEMAGALDGTWAAHSCFLAQDLAERRPRDVHVEPQRTFHAIEPSPAGLALLLEQAPPRRPSDWLDGVVALHLAAHLWWDEARRDFSAVHAGMIDEAWVRTSPSLYALEARRLLPA